MNVLVIDVGGTNIKILATGQQEPIKSPSGPAVTAKAMAIYWLLSFISITVIYSS